jgi:pimeloyl-ACP methyl ester carboxylesterase
MGLGAGIVAERSLLKRRRQNDPGGAEEYGARRGKRARVLERPDGARIFIEESGPKRSRGAVFVHGSALRTDTWYYQMPGIDSHRLVFYDLRGHGLSRSAGETEYSIATLASDLEAVIDDSGLEQVVIVGHSIGGMIALQLSVSKPELLDSRIKGLVLANTTYGPAAETLAGGAAVARLERFTRRPFDILGSQAASLERLRRVIRPSDAIFWSVSLAAFGPRASARQVDFTYDMMSETQSGVIFDLIRSYRHYDVRENLGDVRIPALVIGGSHDRITVRHASEHLAERLPNAKLVILGGCGHMSMLERHEDFNRLVGDFVNQVLS